MRKKIIIFTLIALIIMSLCGCNAKLVDLYTEDRVSANVSIEPEEKQRLEEIIPNDDEIRIAVGEEYKIEYSVLPYGYEDPEVIFSSNSDYIYVDSNGVVSASAADNGVIAISSLDGSVEAYIPVSSYKIPVESVDIREDLTIGVGEVVDIGAAITPENAAGSVIFESSDEDVFAVKDGSVVGVAKGEAELKAYSEDDTGISDTVKVTVTRGPYAPLDEIKPNRFELTGDWYKNPEKSDTGEATLMFAGDLMCLVTQQTAAKSGDTYKFNSSFSKVRDIFSRSDFAIGNLETLTSHSTPYSIEKSNANNNPVCNAPSTYLDAVKYANFDAVVTANNHASDAGRQGTIETIRRLDYYDILHTGTFRYPDDQRFILADINGIKTAVLAYTTIQNNVWGEKGYKDFDSKEQQDYMMNKYFDYKLKQDISDAKAAGAEFIVCYNHWGVEYSTSVTSEQRSMAKEMAEAGVDLIIGSHTHCLQPGEIIETSDGRKVYCIYSMGNFISSVANPISYDTLILKVDITKTDSGAEIEDWGYIPVHCYSKFEDRSYVAVPCYSDLNGGYSNSTLTSSREYIASVINNTIPVISSLD